MSGIVGIFQRDGAPVDSALLQASVATMAFRGPDESAYWCAGSVGMGHTMLRTSPSAAHDHQPATLDHQYWIVADVRLDSRQELLDSLLSQGSRLPPTAPDSELLLNAYRVWGERCVDHLYGDYAFAIWDAPEQKFFCARDHFGIRPFYFANLSEVFVFSNTLNTVLFHPKVSAELNEYSVADFLLFGLNCNNATTIYQNIQRLPPAHTLVVTREGLQQKQYWLPPVDGRIRYSRPEEYVEQFQAILQAAVSDRLHVPTAGILLSGGLDSGAVAATAKILSQVPGHAPNIHTYTFADSSLPDDHESDFARLTADFLSFPNRILESGSVAPFQPPADPTNTFPEPIDNPFSSGLFGDFATIAADCRVVFSGEGGDNLMNFEFLPYLRDLRSTNQWSRLLRETLHYLWIRPFPWRGLRYRFLKFSGRDPLIPDFPAWLNPNFAARLCLRDRWSTGNELPLPAVPHPIHPRGYASMALPQWSCMFETENAGPTHAPVEVVYPFLDLRMVRFLLAIPPFPWFFQKSLTRRAMAGRLPGPILTRQKTPLQGDPLPQVLHQNHGVWPDEPVWTAQMNSYINHSKLVISRGTITPEQASLNARPHCFNFWLQSSSRVKYK